MVKSHGLEREFLYIDASFCAKIFRDGIRGRAGIQEWQHAVQKTLPPARIEPAIQVREGKRVGGERELPCSDVVMPIVAAIERAGPARPANANRNAPDRQDPSRAKYSIPARRPWPPGRALAQDCRTKDRREIPAAPGWQSFRRERRHPLHHTKRLRAAA